MFFFRFRKNNYRYSDSRGWNGAGGRLKAHSAGSPAITSSSKSSSKRSENFKFCPGHRETCSDCGLFPAFQFMRTALLFGGRNYNWDREHLTFFFCGRANKTASALNVLWMCNVWRNPCNNFNNLNGNCDSVTKKTPAIPGIIFNARAWKIRAAGGKFFGFKMILLHWKNRLKKVFCRLW